MRTFARIIATAAVAVAAVGITAPAAHAGVDHPYVILGKIVDVCATSNGASEITVTGNPGDSFRVANLGCGDVGVLFSGSAVSGPSSIANLTSATYTLASTTGNGSMLIRPRTGITQFPFLINVVVTATPVITPTIESHDYLQQVGVPASGDCADVNPSVGHYPGFPVGGWSKSWAWWINDGTGGAVCTRELDERPDGQIVLVG